MKKEAESAILVTFFGAVMMRHVPADQVVERWAMLLGRRFRSLNGVPATEILDARAAAHAVCSADHTEVPYGPWMAACRALLVQRYPALQGDGSEREFIAVAHDLEWAAETGVHYPNKRLVHYLVREAAAGKRIAIVEDFHLGKPDLLSFLEAKGVDTTIFSGVFVSCECNATTEDGSLYAFALREVRLQHNEAIVITGSRPAAFAALRHGIASRLVHGPCRPRHGQQGLRFAERALEQARWDCYHYLSPFVEYATILYVFIRRLNQELEQRSTHRVVFLAREGWLLRQLFETYRSLSCVEPNAVATAYLRCSRVAIMSLQPEKATEKILGDISLRNYLRVLGFLAEDIEAIAREYAIGPEEMDVQGRLSDGAAYRRLMSNEDFLLRHATRLDENRQAFLAYARETVAGSDPVDIVDIGWVGHMQQGIEEVLGTATRGWYLGVQETSEDPRPYERHGLIFAEDSEHVSPYFDTLHANTQLYEQLLAAPHGAAEGYVLRGGKPEVREKWADSERVLYEDVIGKAQLQMRAVFSGLVAWCDDTDPSTMTASCAGTVLRSALIADHRRLDFLRRLDRAFVDNAGQMKQGLAFQTKRAPLGWSIIWVPEQYVRYVAKVQRMLRDNSLQMWLYHPLAWGYYGYVRLVSRLRKGRRPGQAR